MGVSLSRPRSDPCRAVPATLTERRTSAAKRMGTDLAASPAVIDPIAPELFAVEVHRHQGLHLRNRMTVIRLRSGGLWLHSPVEIDDAMAEALHALGPVEHVVSPSKFHHLHAGSAKTRYPDATLWAAPGLAAKRTDLAFDAELTVDPTPWEEEIGSVLVGGMPRVQEVVFLHRATGSLLCCDYLFNILEEASWLTRGFWHAMGVWRQVAQSRAYRFMTRDRAAAADTARVVRSWPVARLVPAHGDILEQDAADKVHRALQWLQG